MFRNKQEVDRHAADVLRRIKDEKERNGRGYQIARLYHSVGEHEIAQRYLTAFISVRESVAQAHKLMGHICEALKDYKKALASYERSLQMDENQKDIVLKICELLYQIKAEPGTMKYWMERADSLFPGNEIIFKLKEKIVEMEDGGNATQLENLLKAELCKRQTDVKLHLKLMRLYVNDNRSEEAVKYAISLDNTGLFDFNLEWYDYIASLYKTYHQLPGDSTFDTSLLFAQCKLIMLRLQHKDVSECSQALHRFDQMLWKALTTNSTQPEWKAFLVEMQGCFFFLAAILLYKRAQKGQLSWKDAEGLASVCFLISENFPPVNKQSDWHHKADPKKRKFYSRLNKMGYFRLSQGGHLLLDTAEKCSALWSRDIRQRYCNQQGKEKLYDWLFTLREMRNIRDKSYLLSNSSFCSMELLIPSKPRTEEYDSVAQLYCQSDLNQLVWLALHRYSTKDHAQPPYNFGVFESLRFSVKNPENREVESLCQLDIEAFLCLVVYCAAIQLEERKQILKHSSHQPHLLPLFLYRQFCTQEQSEWWAAACSLNSKSQVENFMKLRLVLMRGLDTVRLMGSHGMTASSVIHLARTFQSRASIMKQDVENGHGSLQKLEDLEERATFYWTAALSMFQRLQKNLTLRMPKERLFSDDSDNTLDPNKIKELVNEAEYYLALAAMKRGNHESAIKSFEQLSTPWASYHMAQIYKKLANEEILGKSKEDITSENRSNYAFMLSKSRDALYLTLDRLMGDKNHQLNMVLSQDIDDIECQLTHAETNDLPLDGNSAASICSGGSKDMYDQPDYIEHEKEKMSSPLQQSAMSPDPPQSRMASRVRQSSSEENHLRPSPERLDAQLRALAYSQSSILKPILEQNKELLKLNSEMQQELKGSREHHMEILEQLKESQELNRFLWAELSQYRYQSSMMSSSFPATSQQQTPQSAPYMINPSYRPHSFHYVPQPGLIPTYNYQMPSPANISNYHTISPKVKGGSQSNQPYAKAPVVEDEEEQQDDHVDGEYYEGDVGQIQNHFHVPDSQLVQEWPFGHRTGLVGKSTVTYSPQTRTPLPQPGYFSDAVRGQSLQYGLHQASTPVARLPGPGYFSSGKVNVVPVTPTNQQSVLVAALSGKSPTFSSHNTIASTMPIPPNTIAGQPLKLEAVGEMQGFFQKAGGQTPFQLTMPISQVTAVATTPVSAFETTPDTSTVNYADFKSQSFTSLSPASNTEHSQFKWQGKQFLSSFPEFNLSYTEISSNGQISEIPQGHVSFSANGQFHDGQKREMANIKVVIDDQNKGSILITQLENKVLLLDQPILADIDMRVCVFGSETVSWNYGKEGCIDRHVTFQTVDVAKCFLQAVKSIRNLTVDGPHVSPPREAGSAPVSQASSQSAKSASLSSVTVQKPKKKDIQDNASSEESAASSTTANKSELASFRFSLMPSTNSGVNVKEKSNGQVTASVLDQSLMSGAGDNGHSNTLGKENSKDICWGTASVSEASQPASLGMAPKHEMYIMGSNATVPSFSTLASTTGHWPVSKKTNGLVESFENAGQKLFQNETEKSSKAKKECDEEEYEPNVDFTPLVPLPELVDVKTGEENEEKLFGDRARLYRYDVETNQWKERGIGELKLLRNKETGRSRVLMRREQVLKLCANHFISKDMKLAPMQNSDRAWCWLAMDYAEEKMKSEKLAVKFKSPTLAADFKEAFEKCQNGVVQDSREKDTQSFVCGGGDGGKQPGTSTSLFEQFKPKEGSWDCDVCLLVNAVDRLTCIACQSQKPGTQPEQIEKEKNHSTFLDTHVLESKTKVDADEQISSEMTKLKENYNTLKPVQPPIKDFNFAEGATQKPNYVFKLGINENCIATNKSTGSNVSSSNFVFGNSVSSQNKSKEWGKSAAGAALEKQNLVTSISSGSVRFNFGNADSHPFNIGKSQGSPEGERCKLRNSALEEKTNLEAKDAGGFKFGANTSSFHCEVKCDEDATSVPFDPFSRQTSPSVCSGTTNLPEVDESGYYINKDGEDSHIHFEPVVLLPETVQVKTGEEEETVLFEHRAKLYRFNKEWKERGIGNIKILENRTLKKLRLVMRREQVLKVCCNHCITPDLSLKPLMRYNGNAWMWFADDFSEAQQHHEQFSVKFKNADIAKCFKTAFDDARERAAKYKMEDGSESCRTPVANIDKSVGKAVQSSKESSVAEGCEIEVIFEVKATPEEVVMARQFQLPDNFYLYKQKPPCPGCIGCENPTFTDETSTQHQTELERLLSSESTASEEQFIFGGKSNGLLFSSLAAQTKSEAQFQKDPNHEMFIWSGAGSKLFENLKVANGEEESNDDYEEVVSNQDIHFEPTIQLPALVERKSGEEEESVVFCERAKIFRYDNEWKEKGVGQMKILEHKVTGRYRLLHRREQVLKLACNHFLTPQLHLGPVSTSSTSWCWTSMDYSDEPKMENFAVKFKNIEIAREFKTKFELCQEALRKIADAKAENQDKEDAEEESVSSSQGQPKDEQKEDDDCDYTEDDDDDDEIVLFEESAMVWYKDNDAAGTDVGVCTVKIISDDDLSGRRVLIHTDNEVRIGNHMIVQESSIDSDAQLGCEWSAVNFSSDEPVRRCFRAKFTSMDEFIRIFEEGKQLAKDSELSEPNLLQLTGN